MEPAYFELRWPREKLALSCFAHEIMNYRYHWHSSEYELNILLQGSQEFCRGTENQILLEDDLLLVTPGIGHASYAQQANTQALVLHFPTLALKPFAKKGCILDFPLCRTSQDIRFELKYRRIRFYAAQIFQSAADGGVYAHTVAKASLELLIAELCSAFEANSIPHPSEEDDVHRETMRELLCYIEKHYQEKVTLEKLASVSQYNRTYVSTLFKNTIGMNFYEYLMRVRFQRALLDLSSSEKSLTAVALDNGFSDLKSFNKYFRETFKRTPAEYRTQLSPSRVMANQQRNLISAQDPLLSKKLSQYLEVGTVPSSSIPSH